MELLTDCYVATRQFPEDERFGLVVQMRRSALSISSNIAEGCGRRTDADFARFLYIAYGSACELETQAIAASRVISVGEDHLRGIISGLEEIRRMLSGLIGALSPANS